MIETYVKGATSNIASVLSATAFVMGATAPTTRADDFTPVEIVRNQDHSPVAFVGKFANENATDPRFTLQEARDYGHEISQRIFPVAVKARAQRTVVKPTSSIHLDHPQWQVQAPSVERARDFYETLPEDLKSALAEELVSMFFFATDRAPIIERIGEMTTFDLAKSGKTLGVMIEGNVCAISSISRVKELRGTYVVDSELALEDFRRTVFEELLSFAA